MAEQMESYGKNKKVKWLIFLIFILLFYVLFMIAWESDMFRKPNITDYRDFDSSLLRLAEITVGAIMRDQGSEVPIDYNDRGCITITNKEEFVSEMLKALYKTTRVTNMKKYFDADVFKILIQDNFCFIRVNLSKASDYISRNPAKLRNNLASYAARRSKEFLGSFKTESAFDKYRSHCGPRGGHPFLGNFDINSPVVFTEEMNELYMLVFVFDNVPSIQLNEFP